MSLNYDDRDREIIFEFPLQAAIVAHANGGSFDYGLSRKAWPSIPLDDENPESITANFAGIFIYWYGRVRRGRACVLLGSGVDLLGGPCIAIFNVLTPHACSPLGSAMVFNSFVAVTQMVNEKEQKLRTGLSSMGLTNSAYWTSWYAPPRGV